jgi:Domain of unknown function (DUF4276)
MRQIFVGLFTEGTTDVRFLESIVRRTLEEMAFSDCKSQLSIEVTPIEIRKTGLTFVQQVLKAAEKSFLKGINLLCVHSDADQNKLDFVLNHKIIPAQNELTKQNEDVYCKLLLPLIPIQEMEAWMLADKKVLKDEMGTTKTDAELGFRSDIENIANPKEVIIRAVEIVRQDLPKKKRNQLAISELYLPVGQKLDLDTLEPLYAYQQFKKNIKNSFKILNVLY